MRTQVVVHGTGRDLTSLAPSRDIRGYSSSEPFTPSEILEDEPPYYTTVDVRSINGMSVFEQICNVSSLFFVSASDLLGAVSLVAGSNSRSW